MGDTLFLKNSPKHVLDCKLSVHPTQEIAKNIFLQSPIVFLMILLSSSISSIKSTKILGSILYLSLTN